MRKILSSQIYKMRPRIEWEEDHDKKDDNFFMACLLLVTPVIMLIMSDFEDEPLFIFSIAIFTYIMIIVPWFFLIWVKKSRIIIGKSGDRKTGLLIDRDKDSGRWEFKPEQITATITWNREKGMFFSDQENFRPYVGSYNMVLVRDGDKWVRIYGVVDAIILEIGFRKGKDFQTFHLTNPDITDTVIPLTDENEEKALILRNPYAERFAVKKKWMVSEQRACDFLTKLYETQDVKKAMQGFEFEDTTDLIHRLIDKKCYVVPEEKAYSFDDMQEDKIWISKAEKQLQDALEEMQK